MAREFWKGKRVMVSGASGFVGAALCDKLQELGAKVTGLVRNSNAEVLKFRRLGEKIKIMHCDIREPEALENCVVEAKPQYFFHLAAVASIGYAFQNPMEATRTNVLGTANILEVCRKHKIKLITASSTKAYGEQSKRIFSEKTLLKSRTIYGMTKACADRMLKTYFKNYAMDCAIVRTSNIYGEFELNLERIMPNTILSLLRLEPILIYGDGSTRRDFVYIDDVVDAYLKVGEKIEKKGVRGETFNIALGEHITLNSLVEKIAELMGIENPKIEYRKRTFKEEKESTVSIDKAKHTLRWKPNHNLEKGLEKTIRWYREYLK